MIKIGNFESSRAARVAIEGRQETAGDLHVLPPIDFAAKIFQLSFERGLADIQRPGAPGTVTSDAPPKRLDKSPDDLQDLIVEFIAAAEKMRAEKPNDLMAAGNELVQKFLDAGLKRLKNKPD